MFSKSNLTYQPVKLPYRHEMSDAQMLAASQQFASFMKKRHSVRDFCDRAVAAEIIENCILAAGSAPSGANHQPWHFVAIQDADIKHQIREAAEVEEQNFYDKAASDEWIKALEPIGTNAEKPHLDIAPWLIVVFAQKWGVFDDGSKFKNYYVSESVGIATGMLLSALHHSGLNTLTHTPNPMRFLNVLLNRPAEEKPVMIIAVGHAAEQATIPNVATIKKSLDEISIFV